MVKIVGRVLLVVVLLASGSAHAAPAITAAEAAKRLGLSQASIDRVKRGEVVVEELARSNDKDLSIALVAAVDAPLSKVYEFVAAAKMAELSTVTISHGSIDTKTFSLDALTLPDDVVAQLADDPAGTFFLSKSEAEQVKNAAAQGKAQAMAAYRAALSARAKAYWEGGAKAIVPYEGKNRSPGADLGDANAAARKLLANPAVLALLDVVPAKASGPAVHELVWAVQKGRDQAAPVLSHRILYKQDDGEVFIEKRFYSGYDYDALQVVTGVLPVSPDRSAVFYTNHTFTDQVAGFGGGAKRSIGRKLMSKELVTEIERAQKAVGGS